ncbi:MAG: ribosomal RNA small subunit methyltransferase A [Candidatus Liptonbacteria bacterium]|nr:ribosomal RNA small subunit methyltransferase A [Candidatus Liptonbacteria bacterium]
MPGARLGQHFLRDQGALRAVAAALELAPGDTIIEIGAGHGELTEELMSEKWKVKSGEKIQVLAIEKDSRLARTLREKYSRSRNIEIVEGDVRTVLPSLLTTSHSSLATRHSPLVYKLCGNIPYYLTGFLFRIVSELEPLPARAVFTIQKEVAERIDAKPPHMNQLAASVQFWAEPKIIRVVPRSAFSPAPKVDSAILLLNPVIKKGERGEKGERGKYYAAVHALFSQPRKTILNNVAAALHVPKEEAAHTLHEAGIAPLARAQNLSVADIKKISSLFPL